MLTYQDWCIQSLCDLLNNKRKSRGDINDKGYLYVVKAIIDHYAITYYLNGIQTKSGRDHIHLWWDQLAEYNSKWFFKPLMMSEDAQKKVEEFINGGMRKDDLKKEIHLEHITPKGYIFNKLGQIPEDSVIEKAAIRRCLKYNKLVLITKNEAEILDGKEQIIKLDDIDYMCERFSDPKYEIEALAAEEKETVGRRYKSFGTGLLRLCHLKKEEKISFVHCDGESMDKTDDWYNYLTDETFEIST